MDIVAHNRQVLERVERIRVARDNGLKPLMGISPKYELDRDPNLGFAMTVTWANESNSEIHIFKRGTTDDVVHIWNLFVDNYMRGLYA